MTTANALSRPEVRNAAHACVESMEHRKLFSASLGTSGAEAGVLRITGTENNDFIHVSLVSTPGGTRLNVQEGGSKNTSFAYNQVKSIVVDLKGGDDYFTAKSNVNRPITAYGGKGNDVIGGGMGADLLYGDEGNDTLLGGDGNDTLIGGIGADEMMGMGGNDTVDYRGHAAGITLTVDNKANDGSPGEKDNVRSDVETIIGSKYNDTLVGGPGAQTIHGMQGNDYIAGLGGNDSLYGGEGNDSLFGGENDDYLIGGSGADYVSGGNGIDTISYERDPAGVRISLDGVANDGRVDRNDAKSSSQLFGDNYLSDIEVIYGSQFNDVIIGSSGNNVIYGLKGDDVINGGAGHDTIHGGDGNDDLYGDGGNDVLYGNEGNDGLYGGEGRDTLDSGNGRDRILQQYKLKSANSVVAHLPEDAIVGKSASDRVVNFWDNKKIANIKFDGGYYHGNSFNAGYWSEQEIENADLALRAMTKAANNSRVLNYDGKDINFFRVGKQTDNGYTVTKWSGNTTGGYLTNAAFETVDKTRRAITELVGVSLARSYKNIFANDFGWRHQSDMKYANQANYNYMGDGWYALKDSRFVNANAKASPNDDFAQTFTKMIYKKSGWTTGDKDAPAKENWLETKMFNYFRQ